MPNVEDFFPQPPLEGPPIPRRLGRSSRRPSSWPEGWDPEEGVSIIDWYKNRGGEVILYHVTPRGNVELILKEGIVPRCKDWPYSEPGDPRCRTYVTPILVWTKTVAHTFSMLDYPGVKKYGVVEFIYPVSGLHEDVEADGDEPSAYITEFISPERVRFTRYVVVE